MKSSCTAERLREIMSLRNLRQVDILELCKPYCETYEVRLAKNDLSQYISGKAEPGQDKLYVLAQALNVNVAWLMGYDVPMRNGRLEPEARAALRESIEKYFGARSYEAITLFGLLNDVGRTKAIGDLQDMTQLTKYTEGSSAKDKVTSQSA